MHLDFYISIYALIQGSAWIQEVSWQQSILGEAQAIMNPGDKQVRAIKQLTSVNRIAMTGTPGENRLSDLGSYLTFSILGCSAMPRSSVPSAKVWPIRPMVTPG